MRCEVCKAYVNVELNIAKKEVGRLFIGAALPTGEWHVFCTKHLQESDAYKSTCYQVGNGAVVFDVS